MPRVSKPRHGSKLSSHSPTFNLVTNLLIYWYLLIANWCTEELIRDFFETISSKPAKVVKQVSPGFTPFTGFDLARSEKSHKRLLLQIAHH